MPNPYTPASPPRHLAGRVAELARIRQYLAPVLGYGEMAGPPLVLLGVRGVGKTSLLRAATGDARAQGFAVAWTSGVKGLPILPDLAATVDRALRQIQIRTDSAPWQARLSKITAQVGVPGAAVAAEVEVSRRARPEVPPGAVSAVEDLLHEAAAAVRDRGGAGLLIALDELHAGRQLDLAVLLNALQNLNGERAENPLAVLGAGLPTVPGTLTRAATFGERSHWVPLSRLAPADAADLLTRPAADLGVTWDPTAVQVLVREAHGYPYFLQLLGDAAWTIAAPDDGDTITPAHATEAITAVTAQIRSMYAARWQSATPAQQDFLIAMATLGGDQPTRRADIANALGQDSRHISDTRAELLDKAIIEETGRGTLRFSLPGFASHIQSETSV